MYFGKKISVAIATYNGAKYIEDQLVSILQNSVKPDEIIISDDGSKDDTVEIARRVSESDLAVDVSFLLLRDNPRHGFAGNFEHALTHTSGDFVFLCDQDDVWMENKIEDVCNVFLQDQTVLFVIHSAVLIDKNGQRLAGVFENMPYVDLFPENSGGKLLREDYLELSVSRPFCHGMVSCANQKLLRMALPFPKIDGSHDQWLAFCALLNDGCYYFNKELTCYRLHGANTAGHSAYRGNIIDRQRRIQSRIKASVTQRTDMVALGQMMIEKLKQYRLEDSDAFRTATRVVEIGQKQVDAFHSGRIAGSFKLIRLFCTDMRYRRSGAKSFLLQLIGFWTRT